MLSSSFKSTYLLRCIYFIHMFRSFFNGCVSWCLLKMKTKSVPVVAQFCFILHCKFHSTLKILLLTTIALHHITPTATGYHYCRWWYNYTVCLGLSVLYLCEMIAEGVVCRIYELYSQSCKLLHIFLILLTRLSLL